MLLNKKIYHVLLFLLIASFIWFNTTVAGTQENSNFSPPEIVMSTPMSTSSVKVSWLPGTIYDIPEKEIVYEVHLSDIPDFIPSGNTLYAYVKGDLYYKITGLVSYRNYYVKIVTRNNSDYLESNVYKIRPLTKKTELITNNVVVNAEKLGLGIPVLATDNYLVFQAINDSWIAPDLGSILTGRLNDGKGYFRRVENIEIIGNKEVKIITSRAILPEVIRNGELFFNMRFFNVEDVPNSRQLQSQSRRLRNGNRISHLEWSDGSLSAYQTRHFTRERNLTVKPLDEQGQYHINIYDETEESRQSRKITNTIGGKLSLDVELDFEPDFTVGAKWDYHILNGYEIQEAQIIAEGTLKLSATAGFNFEAQTAYESPEINLGTYNYRAMYMTPSGIPVYVGANLSLKAKLSAEVYAALEASAKASSTIKVEFGLEYNPQTKTWQPVNGRKTENDLDATLDIAGGAKAEIRLIPQVEIEFYEGMLKSRASIEPYLEGEIKYELMSSPASWSYLDEWWQLEKFGFGLGTECFVSIDFLWGVLKTDRYKVCQLKVNLFDLPELEISSNPSGNIMVGSPVTLNAMVTDGLNNTFDLSSGLWQIYPDKGGLIAYEDNPLQAQFIPPQPGQYIVAFSGHGLLGELARRYKFLELQVEENPDDSGDPSGDGYLLTVVKEGNGTINSGSSGIRCGSDCTETYDANTSVTLTAEAAEGYVFSPGWSGSCSGTQSTCVVKMDQIHTINAKFTDIPDNQGEYTLKVNKLGRGDATITSTPHGIYCGTNGNTCEANYLENTRVTLDISVGRDSKLLRWDGYVCSGSQSTCTLTINSDMASLSGNIYVNVYVESFEKGNTDAYRTRDDIAEWDGSLNLTSFGAYTTGGYGPVMSEDNKYRIYLDPHSCSAYESCAGNRLRVIVLENSGCYREEDCHQVDRLEEQYQDTAYIYDNEKLLVLVTGGSSSKGWFNVTVGSINNTVSLENMPIEPIDVGQPIDLLVNMGASGQSSFSDSREWWEYKTGYKRAFSVDGSFSDTVKASGYPVSQGYKLTLTPQVVGTHNFVADLKAGDADYFVTGEISASNPRLDVMVDGDGRVTSTPSGINCKTDCSQSFTPNTDVTLNAVPHSGFIFDGWTGECSGKQSSCTIAMRQSHTVGAYFELAPVVTHILEVNVNDKSMGTVMTSDDTISCGSNCNKAFQENTQITLRAIPKAGYSFVKWKGACSSKAPECRLTMTSIKNVDAEFEPIQHDLNVSTLGTGEGVVVSDLPGISCGNSCTASYEQNSLITLTASSTMESRWSAWGGDCTGEQSTTCTITMNQARNVSVIFDLLPLSKYQLLVDVTGPGTVISKPAGIHCDSQCNYEYLENQLVTLIAIPDDGFQFGGWDGACMGTHHSCTITMEQAKNVTGLFDDSATTGFNFAVSPQKHGEKENLQNVCQTELGTNYRLADWSDVVAYHDSGNSMQTFVEQLNLDTYISAMVSRNGQEFYGSTRHYFISYHNHTKPGYYLSHANIDNHFIDLGSWYGLSQKVLCFNEGGANSGMTSKVAFSTDTLSVNENVGTVTITVNRTDSGNGPASVEYSSESINNTATAGADFVPVSGILNWADGDTTAKTFTVTINSDNEQEAEETLYLSLGNTNGVELGEPNVLALAIQDDDSSTTTPPDISLPVNLSTRSRVAGGAKDIFGGFVIQGTEKLRLMLRGIAVESGVNPLLTLLKRRQDDSWENIVTNDEWELDSNANGVRALPGHLQLPDQYNNDAGVLIDLDPGVYSIQISSIGTPGQAVVGLDVVDTGSNANLINISTRAEISGGSNDAFAGFVIEGTEPSRMVLRGIAVDTGTDPFIKLLKRQNNGTWEVLASNDEWETHGRANELRGLASHLHLPDKYRNDAGMVMDLEPGVYSLQLSSRGNSGLAVVGVDAVQ